MRCGCARGPRDKPDEALTARSNPSNNDSDMCFQSVLPCVALFATLASAGGAAPPPATEVPPVEVYAAAAVAGAAERIGDTFQKKTGTPVRVTSGGSVVLSRQIVQGAPADVFIAEGSGVLVPLLRVSKVNEQSSYLFATNSLVVVAPAARARRLGAPEEIAGESYRTISISDPYATPAGIQAKRSLMSLRLWEGLRPRLVISPTVKTALDSVESGESDLGIFYLTDVRENPGLTIVLTMPESSHVPIQYVAALVARAGAPLAVRPFMEFLKGPEARKALLEEGLTPSFR